MASLRLDRRRPRRTCVNSRKSSYVPVTQSSLCSTDPTKEPIRVASISATLDTCKRRNVEGPQHTTCISPYIFFCDFFLVTHKIFVQFFYKSNFKRKKRENSCLYFYCLASKNCFSHTIFPYAHKFSTRSVLLLLEAHLLLINCNIPN